LPKPLKVISITKLHKYFIVLNVLTSPNFGVRGMCTGHTEVLIEQNYPFW